MACIALRIWEGSIICTSRLRVGDFEDYEVKWSDIGKTYSVMPMYSERARDVVHRHDRIDN